MDGPLKGYHHQAFAVRLDPASPLAKDFRWLKLREPRAGVFWYDMRWFPSEDLLLRRLHEQRGAHLPRIPQVGEYTVHGHMMTFLAFIEGVTLDRVAGSRGGRVADRFLAQIEDLFRSLAAIDPAPLAPYGDPPTCGCEGDARVEYPEGGAGSTDFLRWLSHFTAVHAYADRRTEMNALLAGLQVPDGALAAFEQRVPELTDRPRMLIHGDMHRKNFIVDRVGALWTIDWELALIGDPLYDLATHLHLMNYQPDQEEDVIGRWQRAVGEAAAEGTAADLPHYRAYKRVQSVCTDVIRAATRLSEAPEQPDTPEGRTRLRGTAALVHKALEAAREPLGMEKVPPRPAVEAAFETWWRQAPAVT